MKNIYSIVQYLKFLLNKGSKYHSEDEIMDALHHAQMNLFLDRIGNTAKYQPGRPIPPVSYQVTKKVSGDLQPFLKAVTLTLTDGEITLPEDFVYPTSLRISKAGAKIDLVDDDKVSSRLSSQVLPVTVEYPIAEITSTGYRIYPNTVTMAYLKYLRLPVKPEYKTKVVSGEETYDDATSVDLEFPAITHEEIIARALPALGLNVKDSSVLQFGNFKTQQGG